MAQINSKGPSFDANVDVMIKDLQPPSQPLAEDQANGEMLPGPALLAPTSSHLKHDDSGTKNCQNVNELVLIQEASPAKAVQEERNAQVFTPHRSGWTKPPSVRAIVFLPPSAVGLGETAAERAAREARRVARRAEEEEEEARRAAAVEATAAEIERGRLDWKVQERDRLNREIRSEMWAAVEEFQREKAEHERQPEEQRAVATIVIAPVAPSAEKEHSVEDAGDKAAPESAFEVNHVDDIMDTKIEKASEEAKQRKKTAMPLTADSDSRPTKWQCTIGLLLLLLVAAVLGVVLGGSREEAPSAWTVDGAVAAIAPGGGGGRNETAAPSSAPSRRRGASVSPSSDQPSAEFAITKAPYPFDSTGATGSPSRWPTVRLVIPSPTEQPTVGKTTNEPSQRLKVEATVTPSQWPSEVGATERPSMQLTLKPVEVCMPAPHDIPPPYSELLSHVLPFPSPHPRRW